MWKRIALGLAVGLVLIAAFAWINRSELLLFVVANTGKQEVAAQTRTIAWSEGPVTPAPEGERPPNIIFILADDLGINDITVTGEGVAGGRVPTPALEKLAAQGAAFTQAYAGTASCAPSRAMIMTGRYPTRTGFEFTPTPPGMGRVVSLVSNADPNGRPKVIYDAQSAADAPPFADQGLPGGEVTVAEVLREAGYHTVHIGKWHLGRGPQSNPNAQGFDESLLMASGLYLPEDDPDVVNAKLDFDPIDKFLWARMDYAASFNNGDWFRPGGYLTDYWTDEAVKVIEANRNRPFFLYLAHWGPHTPLQARKADFEAVGEIEPHRLRVYAAMVRALDRSVGRVLDAVEEAGIADNTVIVFSSDNGGAGYIGLQDVNAPYRGWKLTLFEGGIRVPLLVTWPGRIPAGTKVDAPVAHIDLMPTLAAAGGGSLPTDRMIDGVDLLPVATAASVTPPHERLFWQSAGYRVVREGDWKLQLGARSGLDPLLYDLARDPTEQRDVAADYPAKVAELRRRIEEHERDAVAPLYPHTIEAPITVDKTLAETMHPGDMYIYWPN